MFSIEIDGKRVGYTNFTFNGGEESVQVEERTSFSKDFSICGICAEINSSSDLMILMLLKDAIQREYNPKEFDLILPYVPYARQDRVCNRGESLAISVFCNILNSMNWGNVGILDPHSDVTPSLINNVEVLESHKVWDKTVPILNDAILVIPDAGAAKKGYKIAQALGFKQVVLADKVRDVATGAITATNVYFDDLEGKPCYIFDDICDGGFTFIKLAEALKAKNAGDIILCVSHGIFSKGLDVLFDAGITHVYTTDSLTSNHPADERLTVINI